MDADKKENTTLSWRKNFFPIQLHYLKGIKRTLLYYRFLYQVSVGSQVMHVLVFSSCLVKGKWPLQVPIVLLRGIYPKDMNTSHRNVNRDANLCCVMNPKVINNSDILNDVWINKIMYHPGVRFAHNKELWYEWTLRHDEEKGSDCLDVEEGKECKHQKIS